MDVLNNDNQNPPGVANKFSNVSSGAIGPETNNPSSSEVIECGIESSFVQKTVLCYWHADKLRNK